MVKQGSFYSARPKTWIVRTQEVIITVSTRKLITSEPEATAATRTRNMVEEG